MTSPSAFSILLTSLKALVRRRGSHKQLEGGKQDLAFRGRVVFAEERQMQIVRWLYLSGLVFAVLIPAGWQMSPEGLDDASRWQPYESQSARSFASNLKRHSEGTFTSDFTRYLDKMKAKDFVHWLINTKRYSSSTKRYLKEEPRGIPFPAAFPPLAYN